VSTSKKQLIFGLAGLAREHPGGVVREPGELEKAFEVDFSDSKGV
jgi:hypothetical protein